MPEIRIKVINVGISEEWWWTNNFDKLEVLPFWKRLLLSPFYAVIIIYLCLKGVPIKIFLNWDINNPRRNSK